MSFDGFVNRCLVKELNDKILNAKIDKIYQPEKYEIVLNLRTISNTFKLLISASNTNPRFNLTESKMDNPIVAPLFCMILRKHLQSGKIKSIYQNGYDRTTVIEVETYNELGDLVTNKVIIEIMGRHSNIILVSPNGIIYDSVKHIDFTVSSVRQILPGLKYEFPPIQEKVSPGEITSEFLEKIFDFNDFDININSKEIKQALISNIMGISPLIAEEILSEITKNTKEDLISCTIKMLKRIESCEFCPSIVYEENNKNPLAFSCIKLNQFMPLKMNSSDSMSEIIDKFYKERSMNERLNQKTSAIIKTINTNIERCKKKINIHKNNLIKAQKRDTYKIYADLITANIYKINYGDSVLITENFYLENMELVEIPLKRELSPSANAQSYYKLFNKAKAAEKFSKEELQKAENEIYYLETVLQSISDAKTVDDIEEIKEELSEQGYIKDAKKKTKKVLKKINPLVFESSDGYTIFVGRNNKENDILTLKDSYSTDIWLHTKSIPGSHTIIKTKNTKDIPETTILEAASIAAFYSKAKNSSQVPVDYTIVKNIQKPNGAKPGFVIYNSYNTVYITPDENLIEKLKK